MPGQAAAAARSSTATINPAHRLVEGVASDSSTIFVSSVLNRQVLEQIVRIRKTQAEIDKMFDERTMAIRLTHREPYVVSGRR